MSLERLPTGIAGLDDVTRGGLVQGSIYLVLGRPGAGKSILGNQIAFAHAKRGGRAVYATLLAETHGRLLGQIGELSFFDEAKVGKSIVYLNALASLESGGLDGLLKSMQQMVREQRAELLVLDGVLPPAQLGVNDLTYKKFVAALQSWVGMIGCTVLMLKSGTEPAGAAEQTMVDGIIELTSEQSRMRMLRRLAVTKFRSTGVLEGTHAYSILSSGLAVYPRIEAALTAPNAESFSEEVPTGISGLDELTRGSITLLVGPSGAGKTTAGLRFALAGARLGVPAVYFGFFESIDALRKRGERLGHPIADYEHRGLITFVWRSPSEPMLDREAHHLLDVVRGTKAQRLVLDGLAGLRDADAPDRIRPAFAALANELSASGVTTFVTDETAALSTLFHNVVPLAAKSVEADG